MTFDIGQLTFKPTAPAPAPAPSRPPAEPVAAAKPAAAVDVVSDVLPATPPPEVLAQVDAAWDRTARLAADNRELHFSTDPSTGRTVIEVRTLDGEVLRTIPPSKALAVMCGAVL